MPDADFDFITLFRRAMISPAPRRLFTLSAAMPLFRQRCRFAAFHDAARYVAAFLICYEAALRQRCVCASEQR